MDWFGKKKVTVRTSEYHKGQGYCIYASFSECPFRLRAARKVDVNNLRYVYPKQF
jgi:hypothetical protein